MSVKYFVFAGGRWCEVDAGSGRVAGWRRRARFLFVRRGRLQAARTAAVLRGLRSLAASLPAAVRDGPPLSQRSRRRVSRRRPACACACSRHCCGEARAHRCPSVTDEIPQQARLVELPSPRKVDACVQASVETSAPTRDLPATAAPLPPPAAPTSAPAPRNKRKRFDEQKPTPANTPAPIEHCKELVINENDVELYRAYLVRHDPSFDVHRFDADEEYKLRTFFSINPLVNVERSSRIARMLRASLSQDEMSLKDFVSKLGLRSVSDQELDRTNRYKMRRRSRKEEALQSTTSDDTDKENQIVQVRENRVRAAKEQRVKENSKLYSRNLRKRLMVEAVKKNISGDRAVRTEAREKKSYETVELSSSPEGSDSEFARRKPRFLAKKIPPVKKFPSRLTSQSQLSSKSQASKRSGGGREYSNLEDHAIVSWVSGGGGARARLVNGNRVWRELQPQYSRLTGTTRSWHSLRNRYLRYILPALGALALTPQHAQRLRAAAAAGELKSRKRSSRDNSMLALPRVASAWSRRPRPPPPPPPRGDHSHSEDTAEPLTSLERSRRVLRSSDARAAPSPSPATAPSSYDEITRRFALRHRPSTSQSPPLPPPLPGPSRSRRLYNPNAAMIR